MKRLIERANKDIREYLLSLVGTEKGKHLIVEDIEANKFSCMGTDIDWRDIPDDLDLTGYEVRCINALYDDCRLSIIFSEYRNCINIQIPKWLQHAIFSGVMQGQESCITLLTKLNYENKCTKTGQDIGYDNTVG
jgi:hypothetical protein